MNDRLLAVGKVTDPKDFTEGGSDHRKSVLASTALIIVLLTAENLQPQLFGVTLSPLTLWTFLAIGHLYFFAMWRSTTVIEFDKEGRFWNFKGLWKQAILGGTRGIPGKTKAQLLFIRALPIWAFIAGLLGIVAGLFKFARSAQISM